MKITDVITHQLVVNVDEPFTSSRGWFYKTKGAFVEIPTDSTILYGAWIDAVFARRR